MLKTQSEVRVHQGPSVRAPGDSDVPGPAGSSEWVLRLAQEAEVRENDRR